MGQPVWDYDKLLWEYEKLRTDNKQLEEGTTKLRLVALHDEQRADVAEAENVRLKKALKAIVAGRFHFKSHGMMDFYKVAEQALKDEK